MNYLIKHIKLLKAYVKLGAKVTVEYRIQVWTNILTHVLMIGTWFLFWNLMFGSLHELKHWTFPMLLLMVGFVQLSQALWQFGYFSIRLSDDIMKGKIDAYMVRPINPVFGTLMDYFKVEATIPVLMGLGIVLFVTLNYFSLDIIKIIIALTICLIGVFLLHIMYLIIGLLTFWFGNTDAFLHLYNSLKETKTFPVDLFNGYIKGILTIVYPVIFLGTYPALATTIFTISNSLLILFYELVLLFTLILIMLLLWKHGIKRYESLGG